jgi:RNA polymerase sigma factor (sigma-70 family)
VTGRQQSDREILASLPDRPDATGVLYERHAPAVFRYLARRAGPSAAEDLLSEVFIAALDGRTRVVASESGSALPWLYGIAMNVLRRHFRQTRPLWVTARDLEMDWDAVDARLDAEAKREQLRSALNVLSHHDRELLLLVAWGRADARRGGRGPRHRQSGGPAAGSTAPGSAHSGRAGRRGWPGGRATGLKGTTASRPA